ncbi:GIY-YIG nuclease family protein [Paractinoplanes toevensis]|uniref:GIY-YIG domain-containing protein n=1 Tax=Paractinoplanes toevensis TaxID=571911 RepID=A0A919T934_9ACTN|nr:GIY-YIG nuclease family protein [Actinoplanes toevensis]GIM90346.1 hypothetical protein Ato02nite_021390 [Actinoplanes toevensis]
MTLLQSTLDAPTAVYRVFDQLGRLLYVGVAIDPEVRLACHAREKLWWRDVDPSRTRIDWFPNRHAGITEENRALETESPIHNVAGTTNLPVPAHLREPRGYDNIRRLRLLDSVWIEYGTLVGDSGRSADIQAYIEWRLDNPDTPLPGKRRGPVKRTRKAAMRTVMPKAKTQD